MARPAPRPLGAKVSIGPVNDVGRDPSRFTAYEVGCIVAYTMWMQGRENGGLYPAGVVRCVESLWPDFRWTDILIKSVTRMLRRMEFVPTGVTPGSKYAGWNVPVELHYPDPDVAVHRHPRRDEHDTESQAARAPAAASTVESVWSCRDHCARTFPTEHARNLHERGAHAQDGVSRMDAVFDAVDADPGHRAAHYAEVLAFAPSTVSWALSQLKKDGLVVAAKDPTHRRVGSGGSSPHIYRVADDYTGAVLDETAGSGNDALDEASGIPSQPPDDAPPAAAPDVDVVAAIHARLAVIAERMSEVDAMIRERDALEHALALIEGGRI